MSLARFDEKARKLSVQVEKLIANSWKANSSQEAQFYQRLRRTETITLILIALYLQEQLEAKQGDSKPLSEQYSNPTFKSIVTALDKLKRYFQQYQLRPFKSYALEDIEKNKDLDSSTLSEQLALAIKENNVDLLNALLAAKINIQNKIVTGTFLNTPILTIPLIYAIKLNHIAIVECLIKAGADINVDTLKSVLTHLAYSQTSNGLEIIKLLLKKQENLVAQLKREDFIDAIKAGEEVVTALLDSGYQCTVDSLCDAIKYSNSTQLTQNILNKIGKDAIEQSKKILSEEEDFSEVGFYIAINDQEQAKKSITIKRKPNTDTNTANPDNGAEIIAATKFNQTSVLQALLQEGNPDFNLCDKQGMSALMWAAKLGQKANVELLLQYNADVNQQMGIYPDKGKTALFFATENAHLDVVTTLLNVEKINIDLTTETNSSARNIGLSSNNENIKNAYLKKIAKPSIDKVKAEIETQINHFKNQGKSFFGIGNIKKAKKIQKALDRALANTDPSVHTDMYNFISHKQGNKRSVLEAFAYHRIGFFGMPRSYTKLIAVADEISKKYPKNG